MDQFVKKHITLAKRKFYGKYFKQHSSDSRKQWQMINNLLNRGRVKKRTISLKNSDGQVIKDPRLVADSFNDYFTNIAERLKQDIRSNVHLNHTHNSYLGTSSTNSIFINPTHPEEVNKIKLPPILKYLR